MKHTMLKCLSLVLALATLVSVCSLPAIAASVTPCNHYAYEPEWTYIDTKDPTCTEYGGKIYHCPNCKQEFVDSRDWANDEYKPLNHKYPDGTSALEFVSQEDPTYDAPGLRIDKCSICKEEVKTVLRATKCEDGCEYEVTKNTATCTENGIKTETCKHCQHVKETPVLKLGHKWDEGEITVYPECGDPNAKPVIAPKDGLITYKCTRCTKGEKIVTYEAPDAHKLLWHDEVPEACGVPGVHAGYTCANQYCQWTDGNYEVYGGDPHNYVKIDHEVNKAVTCTPGFQRMECTKCQDAYTDILDPETDQNGWHNPNGTAGKAHLGKPFASTCTTDGYYVCSACKAEIVNKNDLKHHKWDIKENRAATCEEPGAVFWECTVCFASKVDVWKNEAGEVVNPDLAPLGHKKPATGVVTVKPTCVSDGYRTYKCTRVGCGETVIEPTGEKRTGHNMLELPGKDATCTEDGYKSSFVCQNENCECECDPLDPNYACKDGHTEFGDKIYAQGHTWPNKPVFVPADCSEGAHYGYVCSVCGIEDETAEKTNFTSEADPDAHKFPVIPEDFDFGDYDSTQITVVNAPTCTRPGTLRVKCTLCNKEGDIGVKALDHKWSDNPIGTVPASCGGDGYDVYVCMRDNCDAYKQDNFVSLADNAYDRYDSHYHYAEYNWEKGSFPFTWTWNDTVDPAIIGDKIDKSKGGKFKLIYTHDADKKTLSKDIFGSGDYDFGLATSEKDFCTIHIYEKYTCDSCHYNYTRLYEDSFGATGTHIAIADDITMDCATNTPGTKGRTICKRCAAYGKNTVINEGKEVPVAHTVPKAAMINAVPATCYVGGMTAGGICEKCSTDTRKPVAALNHKVDGVYSFELVALSLNTCGIAGWDQHYGCTLCDAVVLNNAASIKDGELDVEALVDAEIVASIAAAGAINGYKAPLTHKFTGTTLVVPFGCDIDGYNYKICVNEGCDEIQAVIYNYGFANHRYTNDTHKTDIKCQESYLLCAHQVQINAAGVVAETGTIACDDMDDYRAAEPHTNDDPEPIKGFDSCKNWDEEQDHVCKYCGLDFNFDRIHEYIHKNISVYNYDATCKEYKHTLKICLECGWEKITDVGDEYGNHDWKVVDHKDPTYTAGGYTHRKCTLCDITDPDRHETDPLPGVKFDLSYTNKWEGYDKNIFDGSILAVKVITSASHVDVTSIKLVMTYNADVFEYIGFSANNAFGEASYDVLDADAAYFPNMLNAAYGANGKVVMDSVAEKSINGILQNHELNGEETYMTLYFRVANDATDSLASLDFNIVETQVLGVVEKEVEGEKQLVTEAVEHVVGNTIDLTGSIKEIADINGDGQIGLEDIEAMRKLVFPDPDYVAPVVGAADINKDGEVDIDDYVLLQKYFIGIIDYDALANELVGSALSE